MTEPTNYHTRAMVAAYQISAITGEELGLALAHAVEARLAQVQDDREARIERLVKLGLHCAENLTGPPLTSGDEDTWLYDPHTGLPR